MAARYLAGTALSVEAIAALMNYHDAAKLPACLQALVRHHTGALSIGPQARAANAWRALRVQLTT